MRHDAKTDDANNCRILNSMSYVIYNISYIACHMSFITCHMSYILCPFSYYMSVLLNTSEHYCTLNLLHYLLHCCKLFDIGRQELSIIRYNLLLFNIIIERNSLLMYIIIIIFLFAHIET